MSNSGGGADLATVPSLGALPLSTIIAIAVGSSVVLLLLLGLLGVYYLRKRDKVERVKVEDADETSEHKALHSLIRSRLPREISRPMLGLSIIPSIPGNAGNGSIRLESLANSREKPDDGPLMARVDTKRISPTKAFSRISTGIKDSWPLTNPSQMPNALHSFTRLHSQSTSTITLNQVAPPGYMIPPDPQYPSRAYSRSSKTKVSKDPYQMGPRQRDPMESKVTPSENHLTTILRSTSERLKPSHSRRKSLARTLTSFSSRPGPPPLERMPSPTRTRKTESREVLLENRSTSRLDDMSTTSLGSSIFDEELYQTPVPQKKPTKTGSKKLQKKAPSPTPSSGSDDSLCGADAPELIIPKSLTSPNKQGSRNISFRMSESINNSNFSLVQEGSRASVLAFGLPAMRHSPTPYQTPFVNDPFYSGTQTVSSLVSAAKIREPRPLYIRKDKEQNCSSFISLPKELSPPKNFSRNCQIPTLPAKETQSSLNSHTDNPFSWSPQAMQSGSRCSSASKNGRKKGHKRSQAIRMSSIQPSPSSVTIVPEESEEEMSPFKFQVPAAGIRMVELSKSPSPPSNLLGRRRSSRSAIFQFFQPRVAIPPRNSMMGRTTECTTKGLQIYSPTSPSPQSKMGRSTEYSSTNGLQIFSPTLAPINYYSSGSTSEDNIFFKAGCSNTFQNGGESGDSPILPPTAAFEEMISFPGFGGVSSAKNVITPALSPNSEILKNLRGRKISPDTEVLRAIKDRSDPPLTEAPSTSSAPGSVDQSIENPQPSSQASGFLTKSFDFPPFTVPGHLTGPRPIPSTDPTPHSSPAGPPLASSQCKLRSSTVALPSRDSLRSSISILRRMNSEVSHFNPSPSNRSLSSSAIPERIGNTDVSITRIGGKEFQKEIGRGSINHHALGEMRDSICIASGGSPTNGRHKNSRVEKVVKEKRDSAKTLREKRAKMLEQAQRVKELREGELEKQSDEDEEVIVDALPVEASPDMGTMSIISISSAILTAYATDDDESDQEMRRRDSIASKRKSAGRGQSASIRESFEVKRISSKRTSASSRRHSAYPVIPTTSINHTQRLCDSQKRTTGGEMRSGSGNSIKLPPTEPNANGGKENVSKGPPARKKKNLWDKLRESGRPDSLGLYDEDGFLKSSPARA
jgi:hypothetical protein